MKKPIFRVFVSYEIKNKKVVTRKTVTGILDTFVITSNIKEIEADQELLDRICYINKKNAEYIQKLMKDKHDTDFKLLEKEIMDTGNFHMQTNININDVKYELGNFNERKATT